MIHPDCEQGRRLLDGYLMALERAQFDSETLPADLLKAKDDLINARDHYWGHVGAHGCMRGRIEGILRACGDGNG